MAYRERPSKFNDEYPNFWKIVGKTEIFEKDEYIHITDIIIKNILHFNDGEQIDIKNWLKLVLKYLEKQEIGDLNRDRQGIYNDLFVKIINESNRIFDIEIPELEEIMFENVSERFKSGEQGKKNKIFNPYTLSVTGNQRRLYNYNKLLEFDMNRNVFVPKMEMFREIVNDLKMSKLALHYYLTVYVYNLTIKMQKLKSEIIKLELTIYKNNNYNLKFIDVVKNELLLEYVRLDREFRIYNPKLSKIKHAELYTYRDVYSWPSNINILQNYYNIDFDYDRNMFVSVYKREKRASYKKNRKIRLG
tara:strand:- start:2143 stop:3054 length:912 start_codon:yes stop_codon:yes gene_type:complete